MRLPADLLCTGKMWINEIGSGSTKSTLNSVMKKDAKQKKSEREGEKYGGGRRKAKI